MSEERKNKPESDLAESQYLKFSSRHPAFIQLSAIAEEHGTTWQDEARQAIAFYCVIHRLEKPVLAIAKG